MPRCPQHVVRDALGLWSELGRWTLTRALLLARQSSSDRRRRGRWRWPGRWTSRRPVVRSDSACGAHRALGTASNKPVELACSEEGPGVVTDSTALAPLHAGREVSTWPPADVVPNGVVDEVATRRRSMRGAVERCWAVAVLDTHPRRSASWPGRAITLWQIFPGQSAHRWVEPHFAGGEVGALRGGSLARG